MTPDERLVELMKCLKPFSDVAGKELLGCAVFLFVQDPDGTVAGETSILTNPIHAGRTTEIGRIIEKSLAALISESLKDPGGEIN